MSVKILKALNEEGVITKQDMIIYLENFGYIITKPLQNKKRVNAKPKSKRSTQDFSYTGCNSPTRNC